MMRIALVVFVIVIAGVVGFVLFIPHANRITETGPVATTTAEVEPVVQIADSYKKGTHTISGSLLAPNPCTTLSTNALVTENASGTPPTILLTIAMPHDVGICLQEATPTKFSVTAVASADATLQVEVNGVHASTTPL